MEQFTEFMDNYFFYIWLATSSLIVTIFYFSGRAAIRAFGPIDSTAIVFSENTASGYSLKTWTTKRGGASKVLHIIITDKEFILKTYLFLAHIAKKNDLLHRVPLERITSTTIKKTWFTPKLHVTFTTETGEEKEVVLMSKSNTQIKELLDQR